MCRTSATYPKPRRPDHLATFLSLMAISIVYVMFNSPFVPNLGTTYHPHGPEEAPVANQPDLGQLG